MWESIVTGLLLSVLATWLMWRSFLDRRERSELPEEIRNHDYFVQLDRRRRNINGALLLVGLLIALSPLVSSVLYQVALWIVVLVLICFVGMLAMADLQSSRNYLEELEAEHLVAYGKLKHELDRFRQETAEVDPEANGHDVKKKK